MRDLVNVVVPDLKFPEGPRWHDGALWFSDQLGGVVRRLTEDGEIEVVARIDRPSGLGFSSDGALLVATMDSRKLLSVRGDDTIDHADLTAYGKHLNDMYVDPQGRAYVDAYGDDWFAGDLLLVDTDGSVGVAAKDLAFPNGVSVTPDGSTLVVAETMAARITAFDVSTDGSLGNRREWASLPGRYPDGLCLDAEGAAWVASYLTGEFLRVREGGEILETIQLPAGCWALAPALGGMDGRTLYLCSGETDQERYFAGDSVGHLQTCRVDVSGVGRP
jgi:sugar lactone lactonase YvrE